MGLFGFFSKEKKETLDKGLSKTKEGVFSKLARVVAGKSKVDDDILGRSGRGAYHIGCRSRDDFAYYRTD